MHVLKDVLGAFFLIYRALVYFCLERSRRLEGFCFNFVYCQLERFFGSSQQIMLACNLN